MAAVSTHRRWHPGQSLQEPDLQELRHFPQSSPKTRRTAQGLHAESANDWPLHCGCIWKGQPGLQVLYMRRNLPDAEQSGYRRRILRICEYLEPRTPRCPNLDCAGGRLCTKYGMNRFGTPKYKFQTWLQLLWQVTWLARPLSISASCLAPGYNGRSCIAPGGRVRCSR